MAKPEKQSVQHQWVGIIKEKCNDKLEDIYKELSHSTTDKDRFSFIYSLDEVQNALKRLRTKIPQQEKSEEVSESLRLEGNVHFQKGAYIESLEKYNESVLTAPLGCREGDEKGTAHVMALACRSAALFHLEHYRDSINDINEAIKQGYPVKLKYKLEERKGKCLGHIGEFYEASLHYEDSLDLLQQSDLGEEKRNELSERIGTEQEHCLLKCNNNNVIQNPNAMDFCEKHELCHVSEDDGVFFKMGESNEAFTSLSKKCSIKWNGPRGRHVVAEEDIYPGDVVLTEDPYAHILLTEYLDTHCHHCLSPLTLTVTPCDSCSLVRFCSRACQITACSSYHRHECLVLNALLSCGVDKFGLLALRVLTKTPYQELLMDSQEEVGTPCEVNRKQSGFKAVSRLVTHSDDRSGENLFHRGLTAIFISHILRSSKFLQSASTDLSLPLEDVVLLTGSWLMTFLQVLPCNAHSISELSLRPEAVFESSPHDIGAGIYATLSLFNHSCDPGLTRSFKGASVVSTAVKVIRQGEEVCDNYGAVYAIQGLVQRQATLRPQYYFSCWCEACVGDWPQTSHPSAFSPPGWRCEACGHLLDPAGQPVKKSRKQRRKAKRKQVLSPGDNQGEIHHTHCTTNSFMEKTYENNPAHKPRNKTYQNHPHDSPGGKTHKDHLPDNSDGKSHKDFPNENNGDKPNNDHPEGNLKGKTHKKHPLNKNPGDNPHEKDPPNNPMSDPNLPDKYAESSVFDLRRCGKCKRSQTVHTKLQALRDSGGPYLRALDLLRAGQADRALPDLLAHLRTVEETVAHPWRDLVMCQEAVKQCYSLLANCRVVKVTQHTA